MLTLKIGFAGVGEMGRYLGAICHEMDGIEVAAVVATSPSRARDVAVGLGADAFTDHREMLSSVPVDALIVAMPSDTHHEIVQDAISAGVHVFCEKPLAHTVPQCDQLITVAEDAAVKIMVGYALRTMPLFARIREILEQGRLGNPLAASLIRIEKPDLWGWYKHEQNVRIILHEVGTHELDLLRLWLGEVESVQAHSAPQTRRDIDYQDTVQVQLRFQSGAVGTLLLSWNSPLTAAQGHIVCEQGTLYYDWRSNNLLEYVELNGELMSATIQETEQNDGYRLELRSFFDWIRADTAPLVTAQDGRAAVELAEAAYLSLKQDEPVSLPLVP